MKKGFTLIEIIIYIALFSLLIGSAFAIAYQLIENTNKQGVGNTIQDEGNFVLRKLNWALTGASSISSSGSNLTVNKYDGSQVRFCLDSGKIKIREGTSAACSSSSFIPIATDNIQVSSLDFIAIPGTPVGITASFVITSNAVPFPFTITKYLRK